MTPQQQHTALGIAHDGSRSLVRHPDDVMLEPLAAGNLHVDERETDPFAVVNDCARRARSIACAGLYALRPGALYRADQARPPVNRRAMSQAPETETPEPAESERAESEPESAAASDKHARPAFIAFIGAELVALVFYMSVSRPMWFYLDEWDFLANRTGGNLGDLFRAHNEHWVTLPILVYRGMWWAVGLRSYRPYQLIIVLMHLGAAYLVRVIMRRVGVRPWTATIVACVLVFFGAGYQNIILPFQMTLVGSLVFGFVHLLLATHDGPLDRRDYWGLAAGLAALMCSGVGVSMVIAVGAAVLLARGWRLALLHTVPLAAAYAVWYAWIGHVGYNGYRAGPGQIAELPAHVHRGRLQRDGPQPRPRRRARRCCSSAD